VAQPTKIRYLGLAASVLLAVVGGLGGALPHGDLASNPVSIGRGPDGPIILLGWAAGTALQAYAWWSARDRELTVRWVLVTAVLWMLPFLVVPPFGSRDVYSYACQGYLYLHGVNPYAHGVATLPCPWLDGVSPIWRDTTAPYGPLFVLISGLAVWLGAGSFAAVLIVFRVVALLGVAGIAAGVPAIARRCGVPTGRALWVALSGPLIGAHLIGGPHNDAPMVGLLVAGLALALSPRLSLRALAGLLLGLAVAVKVTAIVVIPFAVLLVIGRPLRVRAAAVPLRVRAAAVLVGMRAAAVLVGSSLAGLVAVTAVSGLGFGWIAAMLNTRDLVQFTSPPTAVGMTVTYVGQLFADDFDAVPVMRAAATVLFLVLFVALWWRAARSATPVVAALSGAALALAATVALSPYFHPWYATWPLALLAATTVRTKLVMAVSIAGSLLVLPDGGGLARFVKFPGAPLMTIALVVLLVRRIGLSWRPPRVLTPRWTTRVGSARAGSRPDRAR
jgi:alpha-1,6-mannosyltransferase